MTRINISIPDSFLTKIDHYKKIKKVNRSHFLIDAAAEYFAIIDKHEALEKRIKAMENLFKTRAEIKKYFNEKKIDVVEEIRKMREDRIQRLDDIIVESKHGTK